VDTNLSRAVWQKSTFSNGNGGNCVEVGDAARVILVRDTKDRTGPVLRFTPDAWRRFADRVKRSLDGPQPSLTWDMQPRTLRASDLLAFLPGIPRQPDTPLVVVLDNAGMNRSKMVKAALPASVSWPSGCR